MSWTFVCCVDSVLYLAASATGLITRSEESYQACVPNLVRSFVNEAALASSELLHHRKWEKILSTLASPS